MTAQIIPFRQAKEAKELESFLQSLRANLVVQDCLGLVLADLKKHIERRERRGEHG